MSARGPTGTTPRDWSWSASTPPEFPFERDVENVRQAAKDMRVEYPIALDSDYAIWRAFSNPYWPAVYIADARGRIRHHQFPEFRSS